MEKEEVKKVRTPQKKILMVYPDCDESIATEIALVLNFLKREDKKGNLEISYPEK